jgi:hypothetical protein
MKFCIKLTLSCLFGILLLEGLFSALAYCRFGTLNPHRIAELQDGNVYKHEMGNRAFAELVKPHPYLGIVPSQEDRNHLPGWEDNVIETFPLEKPSEFTVLLVGGSVAQLMGCAHDEYGSFLEQAIEKRVGRPVRILNAAVGATTQPRHAVATLIYADRADVVLCLDGFNEHSRMKGGTATLEDPANWFEDLNPMLSGFDRLGKAWQSNALGSLSERSGSRTVLFLSEVTRKRLTQSSEAGECSFAKLPQEWSSEKRIAYNLGQYRKYVVSSAAICRSLGVGYIHFLQPCPAIGKTLTEDEQRCVGDLSYKACYEHMANEMASEGVVSLLDAYRDVSETVYVDPVHCAGNSEGYRILADLMAEEIVE